MANLTKSLRINGNEYEFVGKQWFGVCDTVNSTQLKEVSIPNFNSNDIVNGVQITVKFTYGNTYQGVPKLRITGITAYPINQKSGTSANQYEWSLGEIITFVYYNSCWIILDGGHADTTYWGKTKLSDTIKNDATTALTPQAVYNAGYVNASGAAAAAPVQSVNSKTGDVTLTANDVGALPQDTPIPAATTTVPIMDGTAAVGTDTTWAKGDHVHPTDTSRAPLDSPAFTGNPTAPTPTTASSISTKQYVDTQIQNIFLQAAKILRDTTANWNAQLTLISKADTIYVYTDYETIKDGQGNTKYVPGIKLGDGLAYVVDLPFIDAVMVEHMNNQDIHVTQEEKTFWNNKNRAFISSQDEENLILTAL